MSDQQQGSFHPLTLMLNEVVSIFETLGFSVALGPELEDEWHNFDALNVPKDHPARDMQDTFFIKEKPGFVLRTHTSSVQIRYMESHTPPFAILVPGKVFRNEATDATHEAQFHQVEGLLVGETVTLEHLKGTLLEFFKQLFGKETKLRFRPSFFPFTEPSVEVDVEFNGTWLEMGGAGMVHPNVFKNVGYDPEKISGFAFGMGLDRLAMIKYNIPDVRYFYQGDIRLNQF